MTTTFDNKTNFFSINVMGKSDIESARLLHNENSTLFQLSDPDYVSEIQQEEWFKGLSNSKKSKRFVIRFLDNNNFVGVFRVDMIDFVNKSACVGLDIVKPHRGKGYSKEIYSYFFDYYFNQLGFNRIYLATLLTNKVARGLYLKLGFVEEGRYRQAIYRSGKYRDLIWMSILKNEYLKKYKKRKTK